MRGWNGSNEDCRLPECAAAGLRVRARRESWSAPRISRSRFCWAKSWRSRSSGAWMFRWSAKLNLGGTLLAHEALIKGSIDLYPEYTGTALTAVLKQPPFPDARAVLGAVRAAYQKQWQLEWLSPLGFNNTFAMMVRGETARAGKLTTLSDAAAAQPWRMGVGYEFKKPRRRTRRLTEDLQPAAERRAGRDGSGAALLRAPESQGGHDRGQFHRRDGVGPGRDDPRRTTGIIFRRTSAPWWCGQKPCRDFRNFAKPWSNWPESCLMPPCENSIMLSMVNIVRRRR